MPPALRGRGHDRPSGSNNSGSGAFQHPGDSTTSDERRYSTIVVRNRGEKEKPRWYPRGFVLDWMAGAGRLVSVWDCGCWLSGRRPESQRLAEPNLSHTATDR
jgi:hypothetical protein